MVFVLFYPRERRRLRECRSRLLQRVVVGRAARYAGSQPDDLVISAERNR